MQSDGIPASLAETEARLSALLHVPGNLGIELRRLTLCIKPPLQVLMLFVHGLADAEFVRVRALEPLERFMGRGGADLSPDRLAGALPVPRVAVTTSLDGAIRAALGGHTALFFQGGQTVLIDTQHESASGMGGPTASQQAQFGPRLEDNVALMRTRLADPALVAELQSRPTAQAPRIAVLYMADRTDPKLVQKMRAWVGKQARELGLHGGNAAGLPSAFGLAPELLSTVWPDKLAVLLGAGYVVALVDRFPLGLSAPVTAPAMFFLPGDDVRRRPVAVAVILLRLLLFAYIVLGSATVVALLSYHQEMLPTPFLLVLAAGRENAAAPVVAEVLAMELLHELIRSASARLSARIPPGYTLVGAMVLTLFVVFTGLVGPLAALVPATVALAGLGLANNELVHMARTWRWSMILAAAGLGVYAMAIVSFLLAVYLSQLESFGVPFTGALGLRFGPGRRPSEPAQGGAT